MMRPLLILVMGVALWGVGRAQAAREAPQAQITAATERGVAFLQQRQHPNGSFRIDYCRDQAMTDCTANVPTAGAIVVLYALRDLHAGPAAMIRAQAARHLEEEQGHDRLWRYLPQANPQYATIPPDLDGSAVAALALALHGTAQPGYAERLLAYRTSWGLFPTFVAATDGETSALTNELFTHEIQSIDPGVNANILALLGLQGQEAPEACRYVRQVVVEGLDPDTSICYPNRFALAHAAGRAYHHGAACLSSAMPSLQRQLLAAQGASGEWGNVLDTALAVIALRDAGYRGPALTKARRTLLAAQGADGSWPRYAYYKGDYGRLPRPSIWYGSEELTTAFVLDALKR